MYFHNIQFEHEANHLDELESQNDSGKRDFVSSFFSKVEIALLLAESPLGS